MQFFKKAVDSIQGYRFASLPAEKLFQAECSFLQ